MFFFAKLYPFSWINNPRNRTAGAAGGCMLVKRTALEEAGGIESIRGALIDDCSLAAQIKHRGEGRHPIRLDLTDRSVSLRPYDSWRDIWNMIARTAFTQLHYSPLLLAGTLLGMTIIYLVPPAAASCTARAHGRHGSRGRRCAPRMRRCCATTGARRQGAGAAARRSVLRRRDVRVRVALLARQGRPVEGARVQAPVDR